MPMPVKRENDLCCPGCGAVLANEEVPIETKSTFNYSHIFLGTELSKELRQTRYKTPDQYYEEKAMSDLLNLMQKYGLPEIFAIDVFNHLKRKNHIRSKKEPIKQLIKILSKDDNYGFIHKLRAIKKDYEELLSR